MGRNSNSSNVDALDNIDLDDMFADDGDGLFEGLDLGLDVDDLTGPPASAESPETPKETTPATARSRRKRKTKSHAQFLEDDDDEDYEEEPKKKKKKAKTKSKLASTSHPPATVTQENEYCGLPVSDVLFYPFLPQLPPEPAVKSRKTYHLLDRVHSNFINNMNGAATPARPDAIFRLLAEALKEGGSLESAINAARTTVHSLDKTQLAATFYEVCQLLQRQYDFLNLCNLNMQRWSKNHLTPAEYSDVYENIPSLVERFGYREFRVRVAFTGYKPSTRVLTAQLPKPPEQEKSKPKAKRKTSATHELKSSAAETKKMVPLPLSYAHMKPVRRRRNISEMLIRTARELETADLTRADAHEKAVERQHRELRKNVIDDPVIVNHTKGMWKYLELTGYFAAVPQHELTQILDSLRWPHDEPVRPVSFSVGSGGAVMDRLQALLVEEGESDDNDDDQLKQVERESMQGEGENHVDNDGDMEMNDGDHTVLNGEMNHVNSKMNVIPPDREQSCTKYCDLSKLSVDERSYLQLGRIGLDAPVGGLVLSSEVSENGLMQAAGNSRASPKDKDEAPVELDTVISNMVKELRRVQGLNNRRVAFLEGASRTCRISLEEVSRKRDYEQGLATQSQQVIRKAKEMKAKSKAQQNANSGLPW